MGRASAYLPGENSRYQNGTGGEDGNMKDGACTASDADTIEVLQAFFVRPIGVAGTEVEILFTKDMSITRSGAVMQLR
ncbi:MAG: hypothetical protein LBR67_00820 [Dysgonamonadaceae bacterium]|nr:hypothetical protein [Dysgonamonadaceae bacterium]